MKKEKWKTIKHKNGDIAWVKGKEGMKLYNDLKAQDIFFKKSLKPFAHCDKEFDLIYIGWKGVSKVVHTVETHTIDGKIIRFDMSDNGEIVGVEVEGLINGSQKQ